MRRQPKAFDPDASLAAAVTSKMEEGNMRAAVRLLCSDERPAEFSDASLKALQAKHPLQATDKREFPSLESHSLSFDKSNVIDAIRSFFNGSGGGPDGFKPGVLKNLVNCKELLETFPEALTDFVILLLLGCCPVVLQPLFFGGSLMALAKKDGGFARLLLALYGGD